MSSNSGSVFKKKMSVPIKHQKVVLPSTCTGETPLVLDFSPFETILQWKRMLECDIFVGARFLYANLMVMNILCEAYIIFFAFQTKQTHNCCVQRCDLCIRRRQWQEHVEWFDSIRCERQIVGKSVCHRNATCTTLSSLGRCARQFHVHLWRLHRRHSLKFQSHE